MQFEGNGKVKEGNMRNVLRLLEHEVAVIHKYFSIRHENNDSGTTELLRRIEADHREAINLLSRELVHRNQSQYNTEAHQIVNKQLAELKDDEEEIVTEYLRAIYNKEIDGEVVQLITATLLPKSRAHLNLLKKIMSVRADVGPVASTN